MKNIKQLTKDTISNLYFMAEQGKYKEKKEAYRTLHNMAWFDNFDESVYKKRHMAMSQIEKQISDEDITKIKNATYRTKDL